MKGFVHVNSALDQPRQRKAKWAMVRYPIKIYALWDPRDGGIRYIGVTSKELNERLAGHLKHPTNAAMRSWFSELKSGRWQARIELIERVEYKEWEDAERGWIHWIRERGELLNVDRGGRARTKTGKLRPFAAGAYVAPAGAGTNGSIARANAMRKVLKDGRKQPVAVGRPGARQERPDPGLVPVARGVFRRAG